MTDVNQIARDLRPIDLPDLPESPLVSVLMANYNYAKYIGGAIESVLAQTYRNWELIVCDDGSIDNSCAVVEDYQRRDPRICLIAKDNGGVASALNAAYAASRGEILCLLDSDDLFLPKKLQSVVTAFGIFERSGVCLNRILKVDKNDRIFGYPGPVIFAEGWVAAQALRGGGRVRTLPPASAISFRRPVTDLLFPVSTRLRRVVDGYLCYSAQFVTEICAVRAVLTRYRCHGENVSGTGEFTERSVSRYIEDFEFLLTCIKDFLTIHYGPGVAEELRLEDNSQYWSFLLALYILTENRSNEVHGRPLETVLKRIQPTQQRYLATALLALPSSLGRFALQCWTGQSKGTAVIVRAARSFLRI